MYAVHGGNRSTLTLENAEGATYTAVDAMSSWWCQIHGYRNPVLARVIQEQSTRISHVMFGGLTHEPAVELAERLVELAPGDLNHVFLADSGSVSVEVALKLAVQYQAAQGREKRRRFIALRGGYHGDTIGAMGVSDPEGGMHSDFTELVTSQLFLPRPPAARFDPATERWIVDQRAQADWESTAREFVQRHEGQTAAVILEPILQGAGGMYVYHPRCLKVLRELTAEFGLLLIFDEIATGFGRTGQLFAAHWAGVVPDVMTVGKALTGGYLTQAAVLVSTPVARVISDSKFQALMHGPTFMGNPLASAISCASLDLLTGRITPEDIPGGEGYPSSAWELNVPRLGAGLQEVLAPAAELGSVSQVRVLGAVGVLELREPVRVAELTAAALEAGVWVRPFRNLVYTMPTFVCSGEELKVLGAGLVSAVKQVHG